MIDHRHFYRVKMFYKVFCIRTWMFKCEDCGDLQYRTYGALWGAS